MKNKLIPFLTLVLIISCGGGGGGGSSTPAPIGGSTGGSSGGSSGGGSGGGTTYSYDPIIGNYSDKTWDAFGAGVLAQFYSSRGLRTLGLTGISGYDLSVSLTEKSSTSLELDYSGSTSLESSSSFNFDLKLDGYNTSEVLLYEYGVSQPSFSFFTSSFTDIATRFFVPQESWLQEHDVDYVGFAQVEIERFADSMYFLLPTFYGDYTETGDMPNGSETFELRSIGYAQFQDSTGVYQLSAAGDGSLNVNFTNNTLSGEIVFDDFMDYAQFVVGNGPNARYTTISDQTVTISNGQIVGNRFTADVTTANDGGGRLVGYFFGPDADELGISLILYDTDGESSEDFFVFSAGIVGAE